MIDLRDPFNPKTGEFAENIRAITRVDNSELRASLKEFGWRKEFPAYKDERGVVLVGHRRLKIAAEEGIKPVIVELELGDGDEADAERLKVALVSNIGFVPLGKKDRGRIAQYLYGERKWTMERIAKALDVNKATVSRDLGDCCSVQQLKPAKTASNPKGAGRPKGSQKYPRPPRKTSAVMESAAATLVLDQGMTLEQAAAQTGLASVQTVKTSIAREEGRRETEEQNDLSLTAQQRFDARLRAALRQQEAEFEIRVLAECKRRLDEISLPHYSKELVDLEDSIKNGKGIMDNVTYRKILARLHTERLIQLLGIPLSKLDPSLAKRYDEAFRLFTELEKRVLDEKESPTQFRTMPRTYEELMAMKAKVQANRRAKRAERTASGVSVR
jgi:hypothetical protein